MTAEFEAFPKISRLKRGCVITEKIDGTNAQVYIPDGDVDEPVLFGSRNRWITPTDDNFGFARWGTANADALRLLLGPGRHFGEWWGAGVQRRYGMSDKRFSLFNDCGAAWPAPGYIRLDDVGEGHEPPRKVCVECRLYLEIEHMPEWSGFNAVIKL